MSVVYYVPYRECNRSTHWFWPEKICTPNNKKEKKTEDPYKVGAFEPKKYVDEDYILESLMGIYENNEKLIKNAMDLQLRIISQINSMLLQHSCQESKSLSKEGTDYEDET